MAVKISGTTVINDSRGLENIGDASQFIRKPSITSPTAAETDVALRPTITGSAYDALFSNTRDYREFQIDLATGDFSSPVVSEQVNADSFDVPNTTASILDAETQYKVRIRDVDVDGNASEFSDEVSFTTADTLTILGEPTSGGFYMGTICAAGTCYYLIVAPNSTGCACCQWKTSNTETSGSSDCFDGYANTYNALDNTSHPAGNWTATRTIGGFSDWYLPAYNELEVFYNNGAGAGSGDPLPSGEDFFDLCCYYWSSTQIPGGYSSSFACAYFFYDTGQSYATKVNTERVRAVRRIPV